MTMERLTLSISSELLEALDHKLMRPGEGRSAAIRRILDEAVREADEREAVERWIASYRAEPQTEEEFGWMEQSSLESLVELPW